MTLINMNLDPHDLSLYPLKILWFGGFHPALDPLWTTILVLLNMCACSLFLVLAIQGILVSYNQDIFFAAECVQTCIIMTHLIGKFSVYYVYKQDIYELLVQKSKFWKIRDFDGDVYKRNFKIFRVANLIIHVYFCLFIIVVIIFYLQSFIVGYLPSVCYVPAGWFNYLMVLMWFMSYSGLTGIPGSDCFFCSLSTSLLIQFNLLGHKFNTFTDIRNRSGANVWNEFKKLVDFHNFLMDWCQKLNAIYENVFLLQFLISIACLSLSVFIFMQPGAWTNRIKFLMYFIGILIETAFYCVPSEFVVNAAAEVAQAVYNSKWYEVENLHLKKCLTVILARCQKVFGFSARGLIWMNLRTFVTICKATFTYYTYLNSVENRK